VAIERTEAERFVALAAREIADTQICFVGIGVPSLAAMSAKRSHAPASVLIYESGAIDADPPVPPLSTGSPSVVANTAMVTSCLGVFSMLQQGMFDLGLLSAAQVDRFGNLNSTLLGPAEKPKVRLVGSGGAHDIAVLAKEVMIMMPHDPRRFVEKVDFVTSPGIDAPGSAPGERKKRGGGPRRLITPRARFSFEAGELTLEAVAHGVAREDALTGIPWDVPVSNNLAELPPIEPELAAISAEILRTWGRAAA
jgi:glutaconate CoA-transferase, subunit B